jgi:hypothetical protein
LPPHTLQSRSEPCPTLQHLCVDVAACVARMSTGTRTALKNTHFGSCGGGAVTVQLRPPAVLRARAVAGPRRGGARGRRHAARVSKRPGRTRAAGDTRAQSTEPGSPDPGASELRFAAGEQQSVVTPQAARANLSPPQSHATHQSCFCLRVCCGVPNLSITTLSHRCRDVGCRRTGPWARARSRCRRSSPRRYSGEKKVANRDIRVLHGATENGP